MVKSIGMREFKAKVSEIMREVEENKEEVSVTRWGQEIARIIPAKRKMTDEEVEELLRDTEAFAQEVGKRWPVGVSAVDAVREQRRDL